jgi:hypothetical protein
MGLQCGSLCWLGYQWTPTSDGQAIIIGLVWLGMTVAFEFLFGHYVAKRSWNQLLCDYNFFCWACLADHSCMGHDSTLRLLPILLIAGVVGDNVGFVYLYFLFKPF